jgi:lysophospholipid acyltransferase (LPLAT)-like uncharacterized protein
MKPKIISFIVSWILKFWNLFIRVELIIPEDTNKIIEDNKGFILAGWHNQILSLTYHCSKYLQKKRGIKVTPLVSHSKDGEYIYETFLRFGMHSVRGSSSRGGANGFRALIKSIKNYNVPIFTPDGPRGPIYKLQAGVVQIAAMTGFPIICFYSIYDRYHEFKSWDRHRFPKFFSKQIILYSNPIYIPKGEENLEDSIRSVEEIMLSQVKELENKFSDLQK